MAKPPKESLGAVPGAAVDAGAQPDNAAGAAAGQPGSGPEVEQHTVLARVLVRCHLGEPDDVVELDADLASTMSEAVDINPAAVAYAQSLQKA